MQSSNRLISNCTNMTMLKLCSRLSASNTRWQCLFTSDPIFFRSAIDLLDLELGQIYLEDFELAAEVHRQAKEEAIVTTVGDCIHENTRRLPRENAYLLNQRQWSEYAVGRQKIVHFQSLGGAYRSDRRIV